MGFREVTFSEAMPTTGVYMSISEADALQKETQLFNKNLMEPLDSTKVTVAVQMSSALLAGPLVLLMQQDDFLLFRNHFCIDHDAFRRHQNHQTTSRLQKRYQIDVSKKSVLQEARIRVLYPL